MKNYIIGSSGFAKETYSLFLRNEITFDGFIDVEKKEIEILNKKIETVVETEVLSIEDKTNINLYIGIGRPFMRQKMFEKFKGFNFPNLIDSSTIIGGLNSIGIGNIICPNVIITINQKIGSFNVFNLSCTIGHDTQIGSFNVFNPTTCISGNVVIDDCNLFGVNSTVLENINIGYGNVIGASTLIRTNLENYSTHVGVPSKKIK